MADILIVCTGNICRSPMGEGFLARMLEGRFGAEGPTVASAGTWGNPGTPAMREAIEAAAERGSDIRPHQARPLEPELILPTSLVLGMTREHRDTSARMVPQSAPRTFTLKELVRLLEALPARPPSPQRPLADLLDDLRGRVAEADALRGSGFAGNPYDEDVVDPLGTPLETYRAVAWEIDSQCERLVEGLFGVVSPAATGGER